MTSSIITDAALTVFASGRVADTNPRTVREAVDTVLADRDAVTRGDVYRLILDGGVL